MDKLLDKTMNFLYKNNDNMDEEQAEVIRYGLELLFIKISFFLCTMIIGIVMGSVFECLIFTILFSSIRTLAGGYHANTRMQCFIISMLTFTSGLCLLKIVEIYEYILLPIAVVAIIFSIVIWEYSPVDTDNKRLDNDEKILFRKKTRKMIITEIFIALIAYFVGFLSVACSVFLSLTITGLLVIAELLNKKGIE